ncbi:alpha/beta hydrolase [Actinotalea sp. M2MS4P-6]|uniref:esterase/lipase family protein n=1 Tax=Actinotalea sp. M2MS4P-6 TaxID=2983762 RepID=UPI0021E3E37D|nr:alpha/beta fold hydrolase [Actinotalea sp. M2MS4P-6]MCV2394745.1 alpha/beta hydrolase [Actinotalea sp. M2MS4P-6]
MTASPGSGGFWHPNRRGVPRPVERAWWRVRDYADAVRWQALALDRRHRPDQLTANPTSRGRPVVLVPGVYEDWTFMRPLAQRLHARGLRVHVVPGFGFNRAPIVRQAEVLGRFLEAEDLRDVLLVAHSKGGLIGKLAMLRHDPTQRVTRMVSLNTPYDGSTLAWAFPTPAVLAFRPSDRTLKALAAERSVNHRITAVSSEWDPHVPTGSSLNGEEDVVVATPGHFRPLSDPAFIDLVVAAALTPEAGGPPG